MKVCSKCKTEKEESEFSINNAKKDKLCSCCKECQKQYYQDNKEKIKEFREDNKEKAKQYYQDNKEKAKQYYQDNKEKIKECVKLYRINNREKVRLFEKKKRQTERYKFKQKNKNHKRRCKVKNLPHNLKQSEWKEILEFFNNSCANCGSKDNLHKDHFIPLASDNCTGTTKSNIIPLCENCNLGKSSKEPREFFSKEKYIFIKTFLLKQKGLWLG